MQTYFSYLANYSIRMVQLYQLCMKEAYHGQEIHKRKQKHLSDFS